MADDFGDIGKAGEAVGGATSVVLQQLQSLPIGQMILHMAEGVADAQTALDLKGIAQFKTLADPKNAIDIGDGVKRTLLQLGFTPHFYFFQKATFEVSLNLTFHVDQTQTKKLDVTLNASFGTPKGAEGAPKDKEGGTAAPKGAGTAAPKAEGTAAPKAEGATPAPKAEGATPAPKAEGATPAPKAEGTPAPKVVGPPAPTEAEPKPAGE